MHLSFKKGFLTLHPACARNRVIYSDEGSDRHMLCCSDVDKRVDTMIKTMILSLWTWWQKWASINKSKSITMNNLKDYHPNFLPIYVVSASFTLWFEDISFWILHCHLDCLISLWTLKKNLYNISSFHLEESCINHFQPGMLTYKWFDNFSPNHFFTNYLLPILAFIH